MIKVTMTKKIFLLISLFFFLFPSTSLARSFTSDNYEIQWGNFNMTGGKKSSTSFNLTDSVGQNAPGQFDGDGYILKSGFQYAYDQVYEFSFAIDNLDINFASLTPNIGTTQSNIITISTNSANGYQILNSENRPLVNINTSTTIPDTTCDNDDCDQTTSTVWTENDTYGFGFNALGINSSQAVTGVGTSNYFTDNTYFRQFADKSNSETAQVFMSEDSRVQEHSARITYKITTSPQYSGGTYQNYINFIAIPKY
jgi:hypothetical protein